jgi:hypothetical protein
MAVLSIEMYENLQAQLELYAKISEAEASIGGDDKSEDFFVVAEKMRKKLIGKLHEKV